MLSALLCPIWGFRLAVEEQKLLAAPVILAESVVEQINPLEDHASVTDRGAAMMTNANAGQYDEVKIGMTGAATSTLLRAISHHAFPSSITPTHAVWSVLCLVPRLTGC